MKDHVLSEAVPMVCETAIGRRRVPAMSVLSKPVQKGYTLPVIRTIRDGRSAPLAHPIRRPEDIEPILKGMLCDLPQEQFWVIHLNTRHVPFGMQMISQGSLSASIVHPRDVFRDAVICSTHGLILAHNHPSGDPTPSEEDVEITQRLRRAGELFGIEILDHLIISSDDETRAYSFRENGLL